MIPVIIPSYCNPTALARCLDALMGQIPHVVEIWDNSPPNQNVYYTRGMNNGIRQWRNKAQFFLLLSQDCYLKPGCLFELAAFMNRNPKCGIACPVQLGDTYGTGVTWGGSLEAWPAGRHIINPLSELLAVGPQKTYWANGAVLLVRNDMIDEIGLMDENMKFLCSDADYSLTARARGWEVWSVPSAQAEHVLDGSAKVSDPALQRIKYQDMLYFTKKWASSLLYKELSHEGKGLNNKIITDQVRALEREIAKLTALVK